MNIREIPDSLLYYLITQKQKENLLRQYLINLDNYVSRKNLYYISCYEKNNIFSYDSETLLNIVYNNISQREEFKPLRLISTFIQEIENNNHSFIYFENEIKNIKEIKTLEYYAKFSEYVNQRTNFKRTSFKYLNNYISMINEAPLQSYIIAMMTHHPNSQ